MIYVTYFSRQNNHVVNTQVRQTSYLSTNKWRLFLTIIEVTLCTLTAGDSSFGTLKRLTEGTVLQNWPFYLVNVIKPAIISEHFQEYRSPIRTLGKNNDMVYLCTGFTTLPLHRNVGMEPKQRMAYATEIADFLPNANCAKKKLSRGQNGRVGRIPGNKTCFLA